MVGLLTRLGNIFKIQGENETVMIPASIEDQIQKKEIELVASKVNTVNLINNTRNDLDNNTNELNHMNEMANSILQKLDNSKEQSSNETRFNLESLNINPVITCSLDGTVIKLNDIALDFFELESKAKWLGKMYYELGDFGGLLANEGHFTNVLNGMKTSLERPCNNGYVVNTKIHLASGNVYKVDIFIVKANGMIYIMMNPLLNNSVKIMNSLNLQNIINRPSTKAIVAIDNNKIIAYNNAFLSKICNNKEVINRNILEIIPRYIYKEVLLNFKNRNLLKEINLVVNGVHYRVMLDDYIVNNRYIQEIQIF